ncbi:MAG: hypothetical protein ACPGGF_08035, partial [Flavobacteriaceae bacterium]
MMIMTAVLIFSTSVRAQVKMEFPKPDGSQTDSLQATQKTVRQGEKDDFSDRLPERPNDTLDQEPFY